MRHARTQSSPMATPRCRFFPAATGLLRRRCLPALLRLLLNSKPPQLDLALVVSLVRPRPRNPSHCRLIRPSPASASIAVGRGGASTAVSVRSPSPLLHFCRLADAVSPRTPPRLITAAARPRGTGRTSAGPSTAATPPLASTRPWPNQAVESAWLPARCRAPPAAPQW